MSELSSYDVYFDKFNSYLEKNNLRKTQERFVILRVLFAINKPVQVDFLYNYLNENRYHVSKTTLYNTLHLLEKAGIVHCFLSNNAVYYNLLVFNQGKSFLINSTSQIPVQLPEQLLKELMKYVENQYHVTVIDSQIYFKIK